MKHRLEQLLVIISFVAVLCFNYLAATGSLNGISTAAISDRYATQLTPAGYAFTIWSLIYFGLAAYVVYQAFPKNLASGFAAKVRIPFILSCAANSAWLVAWHYDLIALSLVVMVILLVTLGYISVALTDISETSDLVLVKAPFNLYFGWVTVAAIVNTAIALVSAGVDSQASWAPAAGAALIIAATIVGTFVRFRLGAFWYPMAIAWGATAIAIKQSGNTPIVVAAAIAVIVLLFAALWGAVKD